MVGKGGELIIGMFMFRMKGFMKGTLILLFLPVTAAVSEINTIRGILLLSITGIFVFLCQAHAEDDWRQMCQ